MNKILKGILWGFGIWSLFLCTVVSCSGQLNGNFKSVRWTPCQDTATFSPDPAGTVIRQCGNPGAYYFKGEDGFWHALGSGGSSVTPGLPAKAVQFNSNPAGTFTGNANFTYESTTVRVPNLTDAGLTSGRLSFAGASGLLSDSPDYIIDTPNHGVIFGLTPLTQGVFIYSNGLGNGIGFLNTTSAANISGNQSTAGSAQNMTIIPGSSVSGNGNGGNLLLSGGLKNGSGIPGNVTVDAAGNFIIVHIPTSSAGLPSGAIYSNAGILTIVP